MVITKVVNTGNRHKNLAGKTVNVKSVSVEDGIVTYGFRKMASVAKLLNPDVEVCFIAPGNMYSTFAFLFKSGDLDLDFSSEDLKRIAVYLAQADMACFSSMTMLANLVKKIINCIRVINPDTYIVWGGIHAIVYPEDAIQYADAVCTGEGETAFVDFYQSYMNGNDYTKAKNFWFRVNGGEIIKNSFLPLHSSEEMNRFPLPYYAEDEKIFKRGEGFVPMTASDYVSFNGLSYTTVWTIGCPYN